MATDGLCGLANMGNSCYLNSCMQILSNTYELNDFLETSNFGEILDRIPESILVLEWNKLRVALWAGNKVVIPSGFVGSIRNIAKLKKKTDFAGCMQNDMQEYLVFILECFHTALTKDGRTSSGFVNIEDERLRALIDRLYTTEYSIMIELFNGIQISQITDLSHNNISLSNIPESFFTVILPIPNSNSITLFSCLELYCKSESLSGDNAWLNEQTNKKQDVDISILFWNLPKILILSLNRFNNNGRKIKSFVDIPINDVDFSKYVKGPNPTTYIYDLYGICNHHGESGGGHYTSYVKNRNGKWYLFNDSNVSETSEDKIITSDAYCIFYRIKK
jgi:ubiquitin C-terminal hydrolase